MCSARLMKNSKERIGGSILIASMYILVVHFRFCNSGGVGVLISLFLLPQLRILVRFSDNHHSLRRKNIFPLEDEPFAYR